MYVCGVLHADGDGNNCGSQILIRFWILDRTKAIPHDIIQEYTRETFALLGRRIRWFAGAV